MKRQIQTEKRAQVQEKQHTVEEQLPKGRHDIGFPSLILESVEWMSHSEPGGTGLEPKGELDRKYLQTLTNLAS